MTVKELMIRRLVEMGMFENQEIQVLELCKEQIKVMFNRWDDLMSDYPDVVCSALFLNVVVIAYEWIEDNCPHAWFKPVFESYI